MLLGALRPLQPLSCGIREHTPAPEDVLYGTAPQMTRSERLRQRPLYTCPLPRRPWHGMAFVFRGTSPVSKDHSLSHRPCSRPSGGSTSGLNPNPQPPGQRSGNKRSLRRRSCEDTAAAPKRRRGLG